MSIISAVRHMACFPSNTLGTSMIIRQTGVLLGRHISRSHPPHKDLSDKGFWEQFYKSMSKDKTFEWFVEYNDVQEAIGPYLSQSSTNRYIRILDVGCGASDFSLDIFQRLQGNCLIDCLDFSEEAIRIMKNHIKELRFSREMLFYKNDITRGLNLHIGNALNLPFDKDTFDIIIDKGTADAVLRSHSGEQDFIEVISEANRVLCQDGTILQFSDEPPETRFNLLDKASKQIASMASYSLVINYQHIGTNSGIEYYMYSVKRSNLY